MRDEERGTASTWEGAKMPTHPALNRSTSCDVCVIGGGIAGITCAYMLMREGKSVVLLERATLASGETMRTSAHLMSACDDRFLELERLHGERGALLFAQSHAAAIDEIEAIVRRERIACDFERVPGYLFAHERAQEPMLSRELEAARRAGLTVEMRPRAPLEGVDTGPCIEFAHQGRFHPLKYLAHLARTLAKGGVAIHERTHVSGVEGGESVRVRTQGGKTVTARAAIVATNSPINTRIAMHTKQVPWRSYVVAAPVAKGSVNDALYWDTAESYHYIRIQPGARTDLLIVGGGEDHKTGQAHDTRERFTRLERWARERFPHMGAVALRWSGQIMEPIDKVALIGKSPGMGQENVYVVTGDSGQGMTHGTIAGLMLADLIAGRESPWAALYDPSRVTVRAAPEFAHEGFGMASQYVDLVTPGEAASAAEIPRGEGMVVREGMRKLAIYRDPRGALHECSAICPHLGCVVGWNDAEKSWDCPCHGSRFTPYGGLIRGPATAPLAPAREEAHPEPARGKGEA